jgi:3-oxoacyl-[acyl-carrier protein] reductase
LETKLTNKVAVITGGSSGIGQAIAIAMAAEGADIAINYYSNDQGAQETAERVKAFGRRILTVKSDVSKKGAVDDFAARVLETYGHVEILVNNAGSIIRRSTFLDLDEKLWDACMELNLKGAYLCSQAFIPYLIEKPGSCIISMSSVASRVGSPGETVHYAVAKAGINILTVALAKEFGTKGLRANAIAPGTVETPLLTRNNTPQSWIDDRMKKTLMGRFAKAEEIAAMAVYLASDWGAFITGQVIDINGGRF